MRKLIAIACLLALGVTLAGCATTRPEGSPPPSTGQTTAGGAVAGAVVGGVIGALCGLIPGGGIAVSVARGAIAGAGTGLVMGAIAGFAYGKHEERIYRDQQAAAKMHNYKPEEGEKVYVETVEVNPGECPPGSCVAFNTVFTVLNDSQQPMPVEVTQMVLAEGKPVGKPFVEKSDRAGGSYSFSVPTHIPENAMPGKYSLLTRVKTPKADGEKTCDFLIAKKPEPPAAPAGTPAVPAQETEAPKG